MIKAFKDITDFRPIRLETADKKEIWGLFSDFRINKETVPNGLCCCDMKIYDNYRVTIYAQAQNGWRQDLNSFVTVQRYVFFTHNCRTFVDYDFADDKELPSWMEKYLDTAAEYRYSKLVNTTTCQK